MKKKILAPMLATLFIASYSANAQNNMDEESLIEESSNADGVTVIEAFKETMGDHFTDPKAPNFIYYDKKKNIALGLGGNVRVRTSYDFDGSPSSSDGFVPYTIPVPGDKLTRNRLAMDAGNSTLFFKVLGNNTKLGQYQLYLSANFSGKNYGFVLQDAYIKMLGFTIGRTWSTFNDLAAIPPTVDYQGPNGAAEMRTEQIRYSRNFTDQLSFGVAAEISQTTGRFGQSIKDLEMSQRVPDIPMYFQYAFGQKNSSHVRVAGVLRTMNYMNEVQDKTKYATGYGVQVSSKIDVCPFFTFYGQMTYGDGIAQYINDLSGNGLSLVSAADQSNGPTGKMKAVEAMGWFVQGRFNITSDIYATAGYSQAKIFPGVDKISLPDTNYRYGQYIVGNLFYNITSDFQLGIEYLYGNRVNINGEKGHANRIETLIQYNF